MRRWIRIGFALALSCVGCKRTPASPCDRDFSGLWLNSSDKHFAYRLRDHGDIIRGEYLERDDDGGLTAPSDPMLIELHRSDGGISGVMRARGPSPSGRVCPVEYGFDVTLCGENAIQAQVEVAAHITDECKRLRFDDGGEPPSAIREFRIERADGGDAVLGDAGVRPP
jgi:hypothetical protein